MKKLSVLLTIVAATLLSTESNAQPPWAKAHGKRNKEWKHSHHDGRTAVVKTRYYYYPGNNVYYSPVYHRYWYPQNGVWIQLSTLPRGVIVVNQPRYEVYYDGNDVWRDNAVHVKRYKPGVRVNIEARF